MTPHPQSNIRLKTAHQMLIAFNLISTRGNPTPPPPTVFCPLLKIFWLRLPPSYSTFGKPSTKIFFLFFALIKKIFLQTLVEIIFRYHKKYFQFLGCLKKTSKFDLFLKCQKPKSIFEYFLCHLKNYFN